MLELLHCAHCGSRKVTVHDASVDANGGVRVICDNIECQAEGPYVEGRYSDPAVCAEAVRLWNTRFTRPGIKEPAPKATLGDTVSFQFPAALAPFDPSVLPEEGATYEIRFMRGGVKLAALYGCAPSEGPGFWVPPEGDERTFFSLDRVRWWRRVGP